MLEHGDWTDGKYLTPEEVVTEFHANIDLSYEETIRKSNLDKVKDVA